MRPWITLELALRRQRPSGSKPSLPDPPGKLHNARVRYIRPLLRAGANGIAIAKEAVRARQGDLRRMLPLRVALRMKQKIRSPGGEQPGMKARECRQVATTLDGTSMDQVWADLLEYAPKLGQEPGKGRRLRIPQRRLFEPNPTNPLRQPVLRRATTGWVEKPDLQPRLRKHFQKTLVMPGGIVRKIQDLPSLPSASANQVHLKYSPWGRSRVSFLPTTRGSSNGASPSFGAGRNDSSRSSLRTVPAFRSLAARKQRRCTTTVSCSFSATNLPGDPNAYSSSRVRSTISRQVEGVMEKGWSGPSR